MSEQHPNFKLLIAGLDVAPALQEIEARPELWKLMQVRQMYEGSAHADTETIVLRGPDRIAGIFDNLDCLDFELLNELAQTLALLRHVAGFLQAREIGRIMLVRLSSGGWVRPHVDEGGYARFYARFHLPFVTNDRCVFHCGEESVHMAAGEVWWFNHQVRHSVVNRGPDRVHLIMDFTAPGFTGALSLPRLPE